MSRIGWPWATQARTCGSKLQRAEPVDDGLGMTLAQLSRTDITTPDPVHEHLPHGFTLLAGAPKAGKATFMEWLAFEVGSTRRCCT